jgi:hypothetical protein
MKMQASIGIAARTTRRIDATSGVVPQCTKAAVRMSLIVLHRRAVALAKRARCRK